MNELLQKCQADMPEAMRFWEEIVNIDSGSGDTEGLRRIAAVLEKHLETLGFSITQHHAKGPESEYNIVAVKEGTGKKSALLLAHMDTVFPAGTVAQRPFTVKGDWAHGPGVSDCKAGIVNILFALKHLEPSDYKRITVLFNCDEEITSPSSKDIVIAEAKKHDFALSYEPGGPGDNICTGRKGNAKIKVNTHGKNSHAGTHPEAGINAMAELVWQVNRMLDLGDKEKKTTAVFTKITSGDRINVVPDSGEAWADVRVALPDELDRLDRDLARLSSEKLLPDSKVEAVLIRNRPPFPENPETEKLAELAVKIYAEIGMKTVGEAVGGVGDINFAYTGGPACLCRLGSPSGGPNHSPDENNYIPALAPRTYLSVRLIKELCG
ncbi:MAG: Carboxypeptidase G2 [Desulfovibrio sp.]